MVQVHTAMKTRLGRAVLRTVIAAAAVLPSPAPAAQLMSIVGLEVPADEYLDDFLINTTNVDLLAVCHVPEGWVIFTESYAGRRGELNGGSTGGVAALHQRSLDELRGLFLIKDPHPDSPIRLEGRVDLRSFDSSEYQEIALQPGNYSFEKVDRCPDVFP